MKETSRSHAPAVVGETRRCCPATACPNVNGNENAAAMRMRSQACCPARLHAQHLQAGLPNPVSSPLPQVRSSGARSVGAAAEWPGTKALSPPPAAARQPPAGVVRESEMEPEGLSGGFGPLAMRDNGTWPGRSDYGTTKVAAVPEIIVPVVLRIRRIHADNGPQEWWAPWAPLAPPSLVPVHSRRHPRRQQVR